MNVSKQIIYGIVIEGNLALSMSQVHHIFQNETSTLARDFELSL